MVQMFARCVGYYKIVRLKMLMLQASLPRGSVSPPWIIIPSRIPALA